MKKEYRLFKRAAGTQEEIPQFVPDPQNHENKIPNPALPEDGYFYFKFNFHGTRYVRCTETTDPDKAQIKARKLAEQIKEAAIREDDKALAATKLRQKVAAKFHELKTIYNLSSVDASASTRLQNIQGMSLLLRTVYQIENVDNVSLLQINPSLARRWFEIAKQKAEAETDPQSQLSIKISANSRCAQARSLFTAKAAASYKDAEIWQDCLQDFADAFNTFKFTRLPESDYNPPADHIINATIADWEKLDNRDLFLAIGHELAFGLRKGELAQAKEGWWTTRAGYPVLDGTAFVKNKSGMISVRALDPFFTTMRIKIAARNWFTGNPDAYIIGGNNSNREEGVFAAVGHWLRKHGWQTQKTNHALRAYAGSQIAMKFGIHEAQIWLRHSTVKVTEDHYTHFMKKFKPADPDALPISWAVATQIFQPRFVEKAG